MHVVITGSTRGIGLGMAREFLRRGHDVVVSSRGSAAVERAVAELRAEFTDREVVGKVCDVADYAQVQSLWDAAVAGLGSVDIWVNNAGRDGVKVPFFMLPPDDYVKTVNTNLIGLMNCNRVVIPGMYRQGAGMLWNMEGFGSNGAVRPAISVYGATKYALRYFTKAMILELKKTPVKVGYLSPGIVVTDLLVPPPERRDQNWERSKKILNILADTVETVTPFLVDGMLRAHGRHGAAVRWLTGPKVQWRFFSNMFRKRDVFGPLGI
ncbi:MAG: SDR family oxidoreductase [Gammaproteobacteria bacterium]|nr:SDR family oxidoreductase [Gammaproteobacteria bacterium]MDH5276694.1 SDR family oxidoreductase [Gammaproteobacteria bacterium]